MPLFLWPNDQDLIQPCVPAVAVYPRRGGSFIFDDRYPLPVDEHLFILHDDRVNL
jgi:hypothetical protein